MSDFVFNGKKYDLGKKEDVIALMKQDGWVKALQEWAGIAQKPAPKHQTGLPKGHHPRLGPNFKGTTFGGK
jgi:hypothetical protein